MEEDPKEPQKKVLVFVFLCCCCDFFFKVRGANGNCPDRATEDGFCGFFVVVFLFLLLLFFTGRGANGRRPERATEKGCFFCSFYVVFLFCDFF